MSKKKTEQANRSDNWNYVDGICISKDWLADKLGISRAGLDKKIARGLTDEERLQIEAKVKCLAAEMLDYKMPQDV